MKKIFAFTVAALSLLAVSCNKEVVPENNGMITKSFTVSAPDGTKTELNGTKSVFWSTGDEINVIAPTSGNQYTFTLTSGAGSSTATFSGEIAAADAGEETFYALYPNVAVRASETASSTDYSLAGGHLIVDKAVTSMTGVKNGFPTGQAYMAATSDASGNFAFHHGAAYFKITMPAENVKSLHLEVSGSARLSGRPILKASDGSPLQVTGAKNFVDLVAEDTFEQGATYYIPVLIKQSNCGALSVKFTNADDAVATVSTASLSTTILTPGMIYDLGSPAIEFKPIIVADGVSFDATATSGSIAYEITNYKGTGTLTAALKEASDWLTIGTIEEDAVNLSFSANTGDARFATVVLTYTYEGSKTVTKEIEVSQGAASGGSISHTYVLYVDGDGNVVQTKDGDAGEYFTVTGTSILTCGDTDKNYFGVDSFTIKGQTLTKAKKIDGSNNISFTTHSSASTTIEFWAAKRQSDKSGDIKLQKGSTNVVSATMTLGQIYDSGVVDLDKNATYQFNKSGEVGVFYIEVIETF